MQYNYQSSFAASLSAENDVAGMCLFITQYFESTRQPVGQHSWRKQRMVSDSAVRNWLFSHSRDGASVGSPEHWWRVTTVSLAHRAIILR